MPTSDLDLPLLPSAEQIRRREFATVRRGYDPEQVRDYLEAVATQVQTLEKDLKDARLKLESKAAEPPPPMPAEPKGDPYQRISERVAGMLAGYDFVSRQTLAYFDNRLSQAPRDSDFALDYVKQHATTAEAQEAVVAALYFKCDVLWAQLDALHHAYVEPAHVPPGAWQPGAERE